MLLNSEICLSALGVLLAVLLRCCTSLHSYSGENAPPMFGDYEAQRHWMEVTVNLPVKDWYVNASNNDLLYWGLDYPPLTAYHSYLNGLVAYALNASYVSLTESRGLESGGHKTFMRFTVLLADVLVFVPAVVTYFYVSKQQAKVAKHVGVILVLLYPGIVLIDHGHFQYNCASLGFAVLAICFINLGRHLSAAFWFTLSLNYKQMELYHALPFFVYLLSVCVPKPGLTYSTGLANLFKIGSIVTLTFVVIWLPFLNDPIPVVSRLFPFSRGVFEDKVANVWCALNVLLKFTARFGGRNMLRYCLAATLAAVAPGAIDLFVRPNVAKFVPALINSSLAFFLFSYQVHEKSILLAAVPVALYLPVKPLPCFWFLNVTVFSMLPLLVKDGLVLAGVSLTILYAIVWANVINLDVTKAKNPREFVSLAAMMVSYLGCLVLSAGMLLVDPPKTYPDLFPLLISVYACVHFLGFFVYFNVVQFRIGQAAEDVRYVKVKDS